MIKAIIFDLDDTLIDTTGWLWPVVKTPLYSERLRQKLPLLDGALENLQSLAADYRLILLTQGQVEDQKLKIENSGVRLYFSEISIVDLSKGEAKANFFKRAAEKEPALHFLSVGNRRSVDLREAKRVGMTTCWFRYGEHRDQRPEVAEDIPDFEISSHREFRQRCSL